MGWIGIGALAIGMIMAPLEASAQTKKHHVTKKHQTSHKKVVHHKRIRHVVKTEALAAQDANTVTIKSNKGTTGSMVTESVQVAPAKPAVYDENSWRNLHADWNGEYHYNSGKYYFDPEYKFPAQIPNDFNSIVGRFGGVDTLENDPTLVFSGDSGEMYPVVEYNTDRVKPDKKFKLKSAFFGRPYFYRDGSRYDRKITVDDKGQRCFQFVKHGA